VSINFKFLAIQNVNVLVLRERLKMASVLVMPVKEDVSLESMTKDTYVLVSQMFLLLGKDGVGVSFVRKRCPLRV